MLRILGDASNESFCDGLEVRQAARDAENLPDDPETAHRAPAAGTSSERNPPHNRGLARQG